MRSSDVDQRFIHSILKPLQAANVHVRFRATQKPQDLWCAHPQTVLDILAVAGDSTRKGQFATELGLRIFLQRLRKGTGGVAGDARAIARTCSFSCSALT